MAVRRMMAVLAVPALVLLACGDDDDASAGGGGGGGGGDVPSIVVTTNILGDVVTELVGDLADVTTVMPVGANPHDFQASAQQVATISSADALVVNGEGFEEALADTIDAATGDGVPTHEAISAVSTLEFGAHEEEDGHAEEDGHEEEDDHGHGNVDPHFFTDPTRMADAVVGIADFLAAEVPALDTDEFRGNVDDYVAQLEDLDTEVEATLEVIPDERRVLVTNHEVFGYFADRYDFEVVGTVIPGGSTNEGASAGEIAGLAQIIEAEGVSAIFAETSSPARLAETLASEVGGEIEIVELFTESLGESGSEGSTYLDMIRVDADRIAAALA